MGSILYLIHPTRISLALIETAAGGLIYIVLVMAIDEDARRSAREVISEFRERMPRR